MPLIQWGPRYSVGIDSLDQQHRQLVGYLNDLHEAMNQGQGRQRIDAILDLLVDYTKVHFGYEEELFAQYSYPGAKDHHNKHTYLITRVREFQRKIQSGEGVVMSEVFNFLRNWLLHHICVEDKEYEKFFQSKGVK